MLHEVRVLCCTGGTGCARGSCQCDEIADNLQDAGILVDKTVLPVTKIKLGPVTAGGQRCVKLGPLKCKSKPHVTK